MTRRIVASCLLLATMLTTVGCGAILNGTRQTVTATSAPDAARVVANPSGLAFTTPASLNLERKNSYVLTFSKEGYSDAQFQVNRSLQAGILILDILLTGLIGVVVDAATGAWYKLSPETATVTLTRMDSSVDGPETLEIRIASDGEGNVEISSGDAVVGITVQKRD